MKIYKFGGASVKNAEAVRNLAKLLENEEEKPELIVISAMGKMTNALEKVVKAELTEKSSLEVCISEIENFHIAICKDLFGQESAIILKEIMDILNALRDFCAKNTSQEYNYVYDQIVSFGEIISTKIISAYLNTVHIQNQWIDARQYIITDNTHRKGEVNWEATQSKIEQIDTSITSITQGFIGATMHGKTTTLGREGSDFSAAIFSYCLEAESMTIWKDVPGVLNADPRYFDTTQLLKQISYEEAVELAFYGASVIHPKTIQPLQQARIPLYVRSFQNTDMLGTTIKLGNLMQPLVPCFIVKKNQYYLQISDKNFGFITENHISEIFKTLDALNFRVNLMQNSALYFSLCIDDKFSEIKRLEQLLIMKYNIQIIQGVSLYTIRHYTTDAVEKITKNKMIWLKQSTPRTIQIIASEKSTSR